MSKLFTRLLRDENAATAIEYALIAMFIATVIVVAVSSIGVRLGNIFVAVQGGFP